MCVIAAVPGPDTVMLDVANPQVRDCITRHPDVWSGERDRNSRAMVSGSRLLKRFLFVTQTEPASEWAIDFIGKHLRT